MELNVTYPEGKNPMPTQPKANRRTAGLDPALVALVKYLARRAAERDYQARLANRTGAVDPIGGAEDSG